MLEILPAPSHVAAFHYTATLDGEDYDRSIVELEAKLAVHDRIAVFADLTGMTGMTPVALAKDLRYSLGKIGEFRRFARGAVVTEREWLAKVTAFAAHFFPHTDLRTFTPAQRAIALGWASEQLPPEE